MRFYWPCVCSVSGASKLRRFRLVHFWWEWVSPRVPPGRLLFIEMSPRGICWVDKKAFSKIGIPMPKATPPTAFAVASLKSPMSVAPSWPQSPELAADAPELSAAMWAIRPTFLGPWRVWPSRISTHLAAMGEHEVSFFEMEIPSYCFCGAP